MPGLHGLNVHTIQVAHTRLRPKLHLFSYHPYGALQRNFKLGIEGENLVLAKIWWETVTVEMGMTETRAWSVPQPQLEQSLHRQGVGKDLDGPSRGTGRQGN